MRGTLVLTALIVSLAGVFTIKELPVNVETSVIRMAVPEIHFRHLVSATTVTVTMYNATIAQCDSTPGELADGTHINPHKVSSLRYCALSRNLLSRWGGQFSFGDTIYLSGIGLHSGYWIVKDVMSPRVYNHVDLLRPIGSGMIKYSNIPLYYSHKEILE